jgi:hypothetical protein
MICTRVLIIGLASGALAVSGCTTFRKGAVLAATTAGGAGIGAAVSGGNPLATAAGGAAGAVAGLGINAVTDAEIRQKQAQAEETAKAEQAHAAYQQQVDAQQGPGASPMGTQHYIDLEIPSQVDSYGVRRVPARVKLPIVE